MLVKIVFGPKFAPAIPVLRVHTWALVFMYLSTPLMIRLMVANRLRDVCVAFAVVVALNTVLNLLVIPSYGMVGAAAVRLFTEALNFAMLAWYSHRTENAADGGKARAAVPRRGKERSE
jgi:O-antigen/teichoic acid export membrane protein